MGNIIVSNRPMGTSILIVGRYGTSKELIIREYSKTGSGITFIRELPLNVIYNIKWESEICRQISPTYEFKSKIHGESTTNYIQY